MWLGCICSGEKIIILPNRQELFKHMKLSGVRNHGELTAEWLTSNVGACLNYSNSCLEFGLSHRLGKLES